MKTTHILIATQLAVITGMGYLFWKTNDTQLKAETLDVERINITENDGTVKMIITNVAQFPTGNDSINNRSVNPTRKKRAGMLFFNEEGMECGGFIYDGKKTEKGHSAGLSLTFDQYDGDQVMQLLTTDIIRNGKRYKKGGLIFNDRPNNETQEELMHISQELSNITDKAAKRKAIEKYRKEGKLGGAPRILLGKTQSNNNGLTLFDDKGRPKAMFYINQNNEVKLEVFDNKGNIKSSWPN